jgi:hypothetical protein
MSNPDIKKIGTGNNATPHALHDTVQIMKPLVKFSIKALGLLGTVLVHIVKNIPKPDTHKTPRGNEHIWDKFSQRPNSYNFLCLCQ